MNQHTLCNVARSGGGGDCGLVDARVAGDRLVGDGGRDGGARVLRRVAIAVAAANKRIVPYRPVVIST